MLGQLIDLHKHRGDSKLPNFACCQVGLPVGLPVIPDECLPASPSCDCPSWAGSDLNDIGALRPGEDHPGARNRQPLLWRIQAHICFLFPAQGSFRTFGATYLNRQCCRAAHHFLPWKSVVKQLLERCVWKQISFPASRYVAIRRGKRARWCAEPKDCAACEWCCYS